MSICPVSASPAFQGAYFSLSDGSLRMGPSFRREKRPGRSTDDEAANEEKGSLGKINQISPEQWNDLLGQIRHSVPFHLGWDKRSENVSNAVVLEQKANPSPMVTEIVSPGILFRAVGLEVQHDR